MPSPQRNKPTLADAIAHELGIENDPLSEVDQRDWAWGARNALECMQSGEIIHPHTVALAKVDLADHHALPIAKSCPIFCLGYDEYAMDPDHADDCAWVEALRIVGGLPA